MATVNITTDSLMHISSCLKFNASKMQQIVESITSKLRSMQSWTDPRAQQFIQQSDMVCKGLNLNIGNFLKMADFLQKFATRQAELDREMRQSIDNTRR